MKENVVDFCSRRASRARCLTILLEDDLPFPWHTIERDEREGETVYCVYGWRTRPHARCATGSAQTQLVAAFPSVEAALRRYPRANVVACVIPLPRRASRPPEEPPSRGVDVQPRRSWAQDLYAWVRALKRIFG